VELQGHRNECNALEFAHFPSPCAIIEPGRPPIRSAPYLIMDSQVSLRQSAQTQELFRRSPHVIIGLQIATRYRPKNRPQIARSQIELLELAVKRREAEAQPARGFSLVVAAIDEDPPDVVAFVFPHGRAKVIDGGTNIDLGLD
jgi:hypothetical protein